MAQTVYRKISGGRQFMGMTLLFAALLLGVTNRVNGQACPSPTSAHGIGTYGGGCAPVEANLYGSYMFTFPSGCNVDPQSILMDVDWGDGTSSTDLKATHINQMNATQWAYIYSCDPLVCGLAATDPQFNHTYVRGLKPASCEFPITVSFKTASGNVIVTEATRFITYHQRDDYYGARPLVLQEEESGKVLYQVCEGQQVCIQFQDRSILNCNPDGDPGFEKNTSTRYLQFEYGVSTSGGTSNIPNVTVGGTIITDGSGNKTGNRIDGGNGQGNSSVYVLNNPGESTGRLTNQICIGKTQYGDAGKRFYITLHLWNGCNQPGSTNPTNDDRWGSGDNSSAKIEAIIEIVKSPPSPSPANLVFCHGNNYPSINNNLYTHTLTHDATNWTPGYYHWYDRNMNPIYTSPLFTGSNPSAKQFSPVTMPSSQKLNPTPGEKGDTVTYWVTYQFYDPNQPSNLCESPPVKVKYTIREDISKAPVAQSLTACERQTGYRIYAAGKAGVAVPSYPFGGKTKYVWTAGTGLSITATGADSNDPNGQWVDVTFTGGVTAPNPGTATITLHQEWADGAPACPGASRTLTVTVNPKPEATISGTGTYCPDQKARLTVDGIKGLGSPTNLTMTLTTDGTAALTPTYPLNNIRSTDISVSSANGTVTTYRILTLKDNTAGGCTSNLGDPELKGSAVITLRPALNLSHHIAGPGEVCSGTANNYRIVDAGGTGTGNAASQTVGGTNQPTQYVWKNLQTNYPSAQTTDNISYTFTNSSNPPAAITTGVEVYWQYRTRALMTDQSTSFCPSSPLSLPVMVYPSPSASASGNYVTCQGGSVDIPVATRGVANQPWEVSWSVNTSPATTGKTTVTKSATTTGSGTITVPGINTPGNYNLSLPGVTQDPVGCTGTGTSTARLQVLPKPTATLLSGADICANVQYAEVSVNLTGLGNGSEYTVTYITNKTGATAQTEIISSTGTDKTYTIKVPISQITIPASGTGVTTVTLQSVSQTTRGIDGADHTCGNTPATTTVNINVTAPAEARITYTGATDFCQSLNAITIPAVSAPTGWTGAWSVVSGPATTGFTPNTAANPVTFQPPVAGIYTIAWTLTATTSGTCSTAVDTKTFSWGIPPNKPNAGADGAVCGIGAAHPYTLNATPPIDNQETGKWTLVAPAPGTATFTDDTKYNSQVTVSAYGKYTFRWTLYSGLICPEAFDDVVVEFKEIPVIEMPPLESSLPAPPPYVYYYCPADYIGLQFGTTNAALTGVTYTLPANPLALTTDVSSTSGLFERTAAPENNGTANDTYAARVQAAYNGCASDPVDFTITVRPKPEMKPVSDIATCAGATVTFELVRDLNATVQYNWLNSNADIGLAAPGGTWTAENSGHDYTFTTDPNTTGSAITGTVKSLQARVNGCGSDALPEFTVTLNPTPVIKDASIPDIELCPRGNYVPAQFETTHPMNSVNWSWTYANTAGNTGLSALSGNTDYITDFTANENTTIGDFKGTVTVITEAEGCRDTAEFDIIVHPRPVVTVANDMQTVCAVETPAKGNWAGITFSDQLTGTSYYWKEYQKIGSNPVKKISGNTDSTTNPVKHTYGDNATGSLITNTIRVAGVSVDGCVSDSADARLNLKPLPRIYPVPDNQTYCGGVAVNQSSNSFIANTPGAIVSWTNSNTGIGLSQSSGTTAYLPTFTTAVNNGDAAITATIEARATADLCEGPPVSYTIAVNPIPVVKAMDPISVCPNTNTPKVPFSLSNSPAGTIEYKWTVSDATVGTNLSSSSGAFDEDTVAFLPFRSNVNNSTSSKTVTVTVSAQIAGTLTQAACGNSSGNETFTVTLKPTPQITNTVSNVEKCPGEQVNQVNFSLNLSGATADSVFWTVSDPAISVDSPTPNPAPPYYTQVLPASSQGNVPAFYGAPNTTGVNLTSTVTYHPSYMGCSGDTSEYTIAIKPTPDLKIPDNELLYCDRENVPPASSPDELKFSSSIEPPEGMVVSYHWYKDLTRISTSDTDLPSDAEGQIPAFVTENTSTSKLSPVSSVFEVESVLNGCKSQRQSFTITVRPVPRMANFGDITVCAGEVVTPGDFGLDTKVVTGTDPDIEYQWSFDNTFEELRQVDAQNAPDVLYPSSGSGNLPLFIGDTTKAGYTTNDLWGTIPQRAMYSVAPYLNGCAGVTVLNKYITVNPLPITRFKPPTDPCVGSKDRKLYETTGGAAGSTYVWGVESVTTPDPYAPTVLDPGQVSFQLYEYPEFVGDWKGWITTQETNNFGCTAPVVRLKIETVAAPIVTLGANMFACSGTTIQLDGTVTVGGITYSENKTDPIAWAATGVNLTWDRLPNPGEEQQIDPLITVYNTYSSSALDERITLRADKGGCTSKPAEMIITKYPIPRTLTLSTPNYCSKVTDWEMEITGGHQAGNGISWYRIDDANNLLPIGNSDGLTSVNMNSVTSGALSHANSLPGLPNTIVSDATFYYRASQTVAYTMSDESTLTCASAPASSQMVIRITPKKPEAEDESYCPLPGYNPYTLNQDGNYVRWYYADTAASSYRGVGNIYRPAIADWAPNPQEGTHTYYVTQTGSNGCESYAARKDLVIFPKPALLMDILDQSNNKQVSEGCAPFPIKAVNKSANSNVTYTWAWGDGPESREPAPASDTDTTQHTYLNTNSYAEAHTIWLSGINTANKTTAGLYCADSVSHTINIHPVVEARFIVSEDAGCDEFSPEFTGSVSLKATEYRWYWNRSTTDPPTPADPADARVPNLSHVFTNAGKIDPVEYHVYLLVSNGICHDLAETTITVYPVPSVDFAHNLPENSICPPEPVLFTNLSSPAGNLNRDDTKYEWNFGDGELATQDIISGSPDIEHLYYNLGYGQPIPRNVILTASNEFGTHVCSNTANRYVTINPEVRAAFGGDTEGCSPAKATFYNLSEGAVTYVWNWGDDTSPGSGRTAEHQYQTASRDVASAYTVRLTASNPWCSDWAEQPYKLKPQPAASFAPDKIIGCQPLEVTFTNTSAGNPATGMEYAFLFEPGSSVTETDVDAKPVYSFANMGSSNQKYTPVLTATNEWGCTNTYTTDLTVYPYVLADFNIRGDEAGCSPLTVDFINGSRGYSTFLWEFGDGDMTSTVQTPQHVFNNNSMYQARDFDVKLTVTSGANCSDSQTKQVTVYGNPVADFRPAVPYPADYIYPALPIQMENLIPLPDREHLNYLWSYNEQNASYTNNFSSLEYPDPLRITTWGRFDITQKVTSPDGYCSDSKTLTVNIVAPAPLASFDPVDPACTPYEVQFHNTSKYARTYLWSFGDGNTSNAEHPVHTYADAGTYTVSLVATGDNTYPSQPFTRQVTVHPMPQAAFEVSPKFLWVGQQLRAFNRTSNITGTGQPYDIWYRWDWGDNTPEDTIQNPSHMYRKAGTYTITLTAGTYTEPVCSTVNVLASPVTLESAGDIILPNTFKPRPDIEESDVVSSQGYQNFLFYPPVLSPTRKYSLRIFTRWGQLLYETTDPNKGWNGYFKGRPCDEGVYVYKIEGVFETGQSFSKMGDVLLLR